MYTKQNKKTSYKNIDFTASMEIFKLFVTEETIILEQILELIILSYNYTFQAL